MGNFPLPALSLDLSLQCQRLPHTDAEVPRFQGATRSPLAPGEEVAESHERPSLGSAPRLGREGAFVAI